MNKFKLLPKVHELVSDQEADTYVLYGGRDSGKSYGVGEYLAVEATYTVQKILCAREYQKNIEHSSFDVIEQAIKRLNLPGWTITKTSISNINGSEFFFQGLKLNPDGLKSLNRITRVWVEEAANVSEESWDTLEPTIREDDAKLFITFNPRYETDPVYKNYILNTPPYTKVVKMNYYDNKHISNRSKRKIEHMKATDYEKYLWVYEGECKKINKSKVLSGKYTVQSFVTPTDADFFYGADWGFSQDPTTLIRCFIEDNRLFIDQEAYGIGIEIIDLPAFFDRVPDSRKHVIRGDNSRPEIISHLNKNGFTVKAASKWSGSVEDGISYLRSFDQIIIHERCTHTIEEAELYAYKVNKLTGEVQPDILDKNNHCIDAIRYALQPLINTPPEPNIRFLYYK